MSHTDFAANLQRYVNMMASVVSDGERRTGVLNAPSDTVSVYRRMVQKNREALSL